MEEQERPKWTPQEIKIFIADWFDMDPDEVENFIMIVKPVNSQHLGVPIMHSFSTHEPAIHLLQHVTGTARILPDDQPNWRIPNDWT